MTPLIVAEIGGSHNGSRARAFALLDAAWRAGADAVKFQCFTPSQMADPGVLIADGPWKGRELLDLYRETHTPREWFPQLFAQARRMGLTPFASVFHPDDVDFLETLQCPMYKISSFELTDHALVRYATGTGKRLVVSTGMAHHNEIMLMASMAQKELTLLKCVSAYPADPADANLATMVDMRRFPAVDVGVSDHTLGLTVPVVATALGASMIERHLTLRRSDGGPDAAFSSEPEEFAAMVRAVRDAAAALGSVRYGPLPSEASSLPLRRPPGGKRGG